MKKKNAKSLKLHQGEHHTTQVGEGVEAFFACTFAQYVHVAKVAF